MQRSGVARSAKRHWNTRRGTQTMLAEVPNGRRWGSGSRSANTAASYRRVVGRISLALYIAGPASLNGWTAAGIDHENVRNELPCPQSKRDPENSRNCAVVCLIKKAAGAVSLSE